jgi:hypothetical protein
VTLPDGTFLDLRPETPWQVADEIGAAFAADEGNSRLLKDPVRKKASPLATGARSSGRQAVQLQEGCLCRVDDLHARTLASASGVIAPRERPGQPGRSRVEQLPPGSTGTSNELP